MRVTEYRFFDIFTAQGLAILGRLVMRSKAAGVSTRDYGDTASHRVWVVVATAMTTRRWSGYSAA